MEITKSKQSKKEFLIDTAQSLFSKFGFIKTTINDIAKAARMGKASLYYYFKDKEDIFSEVIERESGVLLLEISSAVSKAPTPVDKIKSFILTKMKYLKKLANIYSALKDDYLKHYRTVENLTKDYYMQERGIIANILKDGVSRGEFIIDDIDLTAEAIAAALRSFELDWTLSVPMSRIEQNIEKLSRILFYGIKKR